MRTKLFIYLSSSFTYIQFVKKFLVCSRHLQERKFQRPKRCGGRIVEEEEKEEYERKNKVCISLFLIDFFIMCIYSK